MSALWLLIGLQAVGFLAAAGLYLEATREPRVPMPPPAPSPEPRPMHHVDHRMDPCALHGHAWGRQPAASRVEIRGSETWAVEVYHCQRPGCPEVWIHGYVWTPDEPMVIQRPGEAP